MFPCPSIDLSVGVQTASRAPFVFAGTRCLIEERHEPRQRELGVRSSLGVRRQSSQPAGTGSKDKSNMKGPKFFKGSNLVI